MSTESESAGELFGWWLAVRQRTAAMMMRLLQAESGLNPLFQSGWLLSCHRSGCGFAVRGTVSRKSSCSPFHFWAKQRKKYLHARPVKIALRTRALSSVCLFETGGRLFGAVVLMGKSFLLVSLTARLI